MGVKAMLAPVARGVQRVGRWLTKEYMTDAEWASPRLNVNPADKLRHPFTQNELVYGCVTSWATRISAIPTMLKTGTTQNQDLIEDGPAYELFQRPNSMQSGADFWESIVTYWGLDGNAVVLLDRERPVDLPKEMRVFPRTRFEAHFYPDTWEVKYWDFLRRDGTVARHLQWFQVMPLRLFNPYSEFWGVGPLEAAKGSVRQDYLSSLYNESFFTAGGDPGGLITVERPLQKEQKNELLEQFEARHAGFGKWHRVGLLDGKADYKPLSVTHKSMDWLPQKSYFAERIMGCYRVPLIELSHGMESTNKAVQDAILYGYHTGVLDPIMRRLENSWRAQFFIPLDGEKSWLEWDRTASRYFNEGYADRILAAQQLFGMGVPVKQLNELFSLGLEPFDGWEQSYLPVSLLPSDARDMLIPGQQSPPESPPPDEDEDQDDDQDQEEEAIELWTEREPVAPAVITARQHTERQAQIWRDWYRRVGPTVRGFEQKLRVYMNGLWREVASNLETLGVGITDATELLAEFAPESFFFSAARDEELGALAARYYKRLMGEVKPVIESHLAAAGIPFEFHPDGARVRQYIATKQIKVVGVNETIKNRIRGVLLQSATEGAAIGDVALKLQPIVKSPGRAKRVARTEMATAANHVEYMAYQETALEQFQWIASLDEVTRGSHMHNMSLGPMPVGTMYPNMCRYPGDENGPPGEVINCRCNSIPVK